MLELSARSFGFLIFQAAISQEARVDPQIPHYRIELKMHIIQTNRARMWIL